VRGLQDGFGHSHGDRLLSQLQTQAPRSNDPEVLKGGSELSQPASHGVDLRGLAGKCRVTIDPGPTRPEGHTMDGLTVPGPLDFGNTQDGSRVPARRLGWLGCTASPVLLRSCGPSWLLQWPWLMCLQMQCCPWQAWPPLRSQDTRTFISTHESALML
jgi:hypothetical protein